MGQQGWTLVDCVTFGARHSCSALPTCFRHEIVPLAHVLHCCSCYYHSRLVLDALLLYGAMLCAVSGCWYQHKTIFGVVSWRGSWNASPLAAALICYAFVLRSADMLQLVLRLLLVSSLKDVGNSLQQAFKAAVLAAALCTVGPGTIVTIGHRH
jgi:hypothetical protein